MTLLKGRPVLVPQADAMGMIAVIRSLGRAGLEVHAISERPQALGLRSNFAFRSEVCPPLASAEFPDWLADYCQRFDIQTIMPTESLMLALRDNLSRFSKLLPISHDLEKIRIAYSKARTCMLYQQHGLLEYMPPALVFTKDNFSKQKSKIETLALTAYVKADAVDALTGKTGSGVVRPAETYALALQHVEQMLEDYSHVQVQGYAVGKGAGVNCLRWNDHYQATFVNYCDHESPHTGGLSSLRRTWHSPEMVLDAHQRLDVLGWQGVAMVEYKLNPATQEFFYIETNARFWAALHLALYAGADFPIYLVAAHAGLNIDINEDWRVLSCCHDLPDEVAHVSSILKDSNISSLTKLGRVAMFFSHYVNPAIKFDLHFPGDRKLYYINLMRFFGIKV